MLRVARFGALVATAALVGVACTTGGGGGQQGGGGTAQAVEITIAIGAEPTTLDPQVRDDGNERAVNDNIYETLIARTAEGDLTPGLAADMPVQIDDTTWQVKLRDGISFTNGEPLNADAVVASFDRILDPALASEQLGYIPTIVGAEKVDDLTVNILTNGPDPVLPSRLYWTPKIVPPEYSQDPAFADAPVGTGPYELVEWVKGDRVVLERNPDYWGPAPDVDRVTFRFVEDSGTRLAGVQSGEFDVITNVSPDDIQSVPQFASVQGPEHPVIILDAREGITSDVRVRQALNYAVNKEELGATLFGGYAVPDSCQVLSPDWFGFDPSLQPYPYDPDRARSLLEEAGATGAQIELVGESGRWLKDRETIEAVANFWEQVGLNVKVRIFTFEEYLNRLFDQESRPQAIYLSHGNELKDADRTFSTYYQEGGIGSSNSDPQLKELIDQGRTETDPAKRLSIYNQVAQIGCDQAYFVFLLNTQDLYGLTERMSWQPRTDAKILVKEMSVKA